MGPRDQARRLSAIVRRIGDKVRLITRGGYDWAERYPLIVKAARALKVRSATIDGEAVVCGPDGVSDFERLHSRDHDAQVILYAFDLSGIGRRGLTRAAAGRTQGNAHEALRRAPIGIHLTEHMEGNGPIIFEHACKLGLEGIVSKRRDALHRGQCKAWLKTKNPKSPAMLRRGGDVVVPLLSVCGAASGVFGGPIGRQGCDQRATHAPCPQSG